jgi:hypothetical protein
MPDDLRAELEKSANKKGWSLSQELLWRVRSSYNKQREREEEWRSTRAICYLIGEIAKSVGYFEPSKWHRSHFAFRAFRLAVAQLLEDMEPPADAHNPYEPIIENYRKQGSKLFLAIADKLAPMYKTPETTADATAKRLIEEVVHPRLEEDVFKYLRNHPHPLVKNVAEATMDNIYGMADVRRDLGVRAAEPKNLTPLGSLVPLLRE